MTLSLAAALGALGGWGLGAVFALFRDGFDGHVLGGLPSPFTLIALSSLVTLVVSWIAMAVTILMANAI